MDGWTAKWSDAPVDRQMEGKTKLTDLLTFSVVNQFIGCKIVIKSQNEIISFSLLSLAYSFWVKNQNNTQ